MNKLQRRREVLSAEQLELKHSSKPVTLHDNWLLDESSVDSQQVPNQLDGLRVTDIMTSSTIGSPEKINRSKKIRAVFVFVTAITDIVLAWIEVLNVAQTECQVELDMTYLFARFGLYFLSRFYLMSLWNIETVSLHPYSSTDILRRRCLDARVAADVARHDESATVRHIHL